ncbi:MAG: type II secretion system protein [Betaproteobacteria bacterium]|nr:type II secretion system protein [Betaproteobacteria bacterium]
MDRLCYPVKRLNRARAEAPEAQRGFTLIELVVTMILVGILAVFVLPRFDLFSGFDEIGYRDKVKATIEFARKAAVAERRYTCVTVSGNGLVLTVDVRDPDPLTPATVICPDSSPNRLLLPSPDSKYCGSATVGNKICAPNNITLGAPTSAIIFSPLGRPSGTSNCTPGYCYTVTGASAHTVTVEAESGYVH